MAEFEIRLSPISESEFPSIVVNDESCLIGRDTPVFKAWRDVRLKRLSREHARFEINGASASLCDLGSTNGTKINHVQLIANEPHSLKHGDIVTFAKVFKYQVTFVRSRSADNTVFTDMTGEEHGAARIIKNKTMFIASADSYLDLLCEENDDGKEDEGLQRAAKNLRLRIVIATAVIIVIVGGSMVYLRFFG